jgi:hypothetical protein
MGSHSRYESNHIVLKYFRLIDEKDMYSLLNVFTDDCVIYEPFSRERPSYDNGGIGKNGLRGKSEIESFFHVVMMASDGLQQRDDIVNSKSSSIVSALATFYRNKGEDELKERLTFHTVSKENDDNTNDIMTGNNGYNNNRKIKTLWIQFCASD